MLNGNNYDTYFAQPYLKNCGVVVRSNDDDELLLDNDHISSFSMSRQNYGVPEQVPNDNTTITIKGWDTLDQEIKDYLCDSSKFVKIGFVVENEETTNYIVQLIERCKINYKGDTATLSCSSPYKLILNTVDVLYILSPRSLMPFKTTQSEYEQHKTISLGLGMIINPVDYGDSYSPITAPPINNHQIGTTKNINDNNFDTFFPISKVADIYIDQDTTNRDSLIACGIEVMEEEVVFTQDFSNKQNGYFAFDTQYVITDWNAWWKPTALSTPQPVSYMLATKTSVGMNVMVVAPLDPSYLYSFQIKGYTANVKYADNPCTIECKMVLDSDTTAISNIQTNYRDYFSHKDYYEFEGIIDPRIEPLDNVFVEGIGTIKVETIDLSFNGGFSGRFKGRLVYAIGKLTAPDITYNSGDPDTGFELDILNQNNVPCTLVIVHSGGGQIEIDFEGGEELGLTTDDEIADLYDSYVAWYNGDLEDTVYCYFISQYGTKSDNVIILQGSN